MVVGAMGSEEYIYVYEKSNFILHTVMFVPFILVNKILKIPPINHTRARARVIFIDYDVVMWCL